MAAMADYADMDDMVCERGSGPVNGVFMNGGVNTGGEAVGATQSGEYAPPGRPQRESTPASDTGSDDSDFPEEDDPATTFRGFPQPAVDTRLESIKIFLADEDPDRHLYFNQRFEEINDYIKHIEEHDLSCNPTLLKDVKIMAQVHKDWQKDRTRRLPSGCVHANEKHRNTRTSTRLINAEVSAKILETRRAYGVDTQLRADHAPFTVNRVGDEIEFANAMNKDANEDIFTIDPSKNLVSVENEAYNMALMNPAMIPYWMHPTNGLSQTGQMNGESVEPLLHEPTEVELNRPYRKPLRDYLRAREDKINNLLNTKGITNEEFLQLEELLRLHEPIEIRNLYAEWQTYLYRNAEGKESHEVLQRRDAYHAARDAWLDTFRYTGVYLIELPVPEKSTEPGVFYLPGPNAISPEGDQPLVEKATVLNSLTEHLRTVGSYKHLSQQDKIAMDLIMIDFAPRSFNRRDAPNFSGLPNDNPVAIQWCEWIDTVAHLYPRILPLHPGEMPSDNPAELNIPWVPPQTEEELVLPAETPFDKFWETDGLVKKHLNPRLGDLSRAEMARLRALVSGFYHDFVLQLHNKGLQEGARNANVSNFDTQGGNNIQKPKLAQIPRTATHAELEHLQGMIEWYNKEAEENRLILESDPEAAARGEIQEMHELDENFTEDFAEWFKTSTLNGTALTSGMAGHIPQAVDFRAKAKRRGIQRAAIELALNLLATNQEQHRPDDRFRILKLPPVYTPPKKEVPVALPLEDWARPVERDTFEFSKKIAAYQRQKDCDYSIARNNLARSLPGQLEAPLNFNGPCISLDGNDKHRAAKGRLQLLADHKAQLAEAQKNSPRPLLQQMLWRISWYSNPRSKVEKQPAFSPLDERNLLLLSELAEGSWDEEAEPYKWDMFDESEHQLSLFLEFEKDLFSENIMALIPLWQAPIETDIPVEDEVALCAPVPYGPRIHSETGISLTRLRQRINDMRVGFGGTNIRLWSSQEVYDFLTFMQSHSRIHLHMDENGEFQASKVPLTGHPENKYVTSVEEASTSLGVHLAAGNTLAVRYDAKGKIGPPIVQPNSIEHFLSLAQRLGREILEWIEILAIPAESWAKEVIIEDHLEDALKAKKMMQDVTVEDREDQGLDPDLTQITYDLKLMALELDRHAPDLAQEAGFVWDEEVEEPNLEIATQEDIDRWQKRQSEYAAILQMKCLEELNNNFELRFPDNEKVWDFASERVASTTQIVNGKPIEVIPRRKQFFSMQRWPVECQRPETQEAIINSGPVVPDKPVAAPAPPKPTREEMIKQAITPQKKKARHIKGRAPRFPFGETNYQAAYLSYKMEEDLKDVPQFQAKEDKRWNFPWTEEKKPTVQPYSLPTLSENWKPDNISKAEKHHYLLEWARNAPGFPDPDILENYYTAEEIPYIKAEEAEKEKRDAARALKEELKRYGKNPTREEVEAAGERLGINPQTGLYLTEMEIWARRKRREKERREQVSDAGESMAENGGGANGGSKRGGSGLLGPPSKRARS